MKKLRNHFNQSKVFYCIIVLAVLLRTIGLSTNPPALYSDEINQGYNAYLLLHTGADEHGAVFPTSFRSFGDWKPPLQTYVMIPFIAIMGLNEYAVRLPGALLGVVTIWCLYKILTMTIDQNKQFRYLPLIASFFLTVSPWHIHQSRMAMLTSVSLGFYALGILYFIKGISNPKNLIISSVCFALTIYGYYGMRLIVPLTLICLYLTHYKSINRAKKETFIAVLVGFFILSFLIVGFIKNPDVLFGRAKSVSIFADKGIQLIQWEKLTQDGPSYSHKLSLIYHNKKMMYVYDIARRFLQHFEGEFLLLKGDGHLPFQLPSMGVLYFIDLPFLLIGCFRIINNLFLKFFRVNL